VVQNFSIEPSLADPEVSFDGLTNQNNAGNFGFQVFPPDTNGDIGPNHYVQMSNLLVRVFDKAGVPLTQPFRLSSLFQQLGGQCAAQDAGDPVVLYDPLSDRWLLSQFAFASPTAPPYHECFAISQTPDPTGAYFLFDFVTPGANFPDYPKLGVWSDAYYMTTNQFLNGATFNGAGVFAFERAKMVAGDPTAAMIYFDLNVTAHPERIGGMLPADVDGLTPPRPGTPGVFAYFVADEFGDAADAVRVFDFRANFANPAASTFTERAESPIRVAPFNPVTPAGRDDVVQPPPASTAAALDSISDRLMFRLAYRNFGDHESLVATHSVNVGTGVSLTTYRSGVRYYEFRRSTGQAFAVAEQATFAPDTDSRWMPSGAMDHQGNLAIGYNVASLTTRPSMRYAGRLATDPSGGLFQGERSLITGSGVQTNTGSRWGDYSALNVDPADDCTFWFTSEYYSAASQAGSSIGWLTRIGRFRFPECVNAVPAVLQGTVTNARTGNVAVAIRDLATEIVPIEVTDPGQIVDVDVRIRANHTFDADVSFLLISPDGTTVDLSSRNGGGGDNYGDGATDCSGRPTVFDDSAPNAIVGAAAPFAASFRPEQPLSRFNGHSSQGTWRLQITDSAGADVGTLFCAQLVFKVRAQLCCDPNGTPIIIADSSSIVTEEFVPANGAADPGEPVRYQFNVRNVGNGNTSHLRATLLDGNGVTSPHEEGVYGVVQTGGVPVGADFQFTADGVCGATIQPTLAVSDGVQDLGTVSFPVRLGTNDVGQTSAAEPSSLTINDTPRVSGVALATPYPSTINVSGVSGTVKSVRVSLNGMNHTFPSDIDILLVGPQGQQVILLSDAGGGTDMVNVNLTFDDAAPTPVPATIVSGTFRPTNIGGGDIFPGAPAGAPAAALATFAGTDPNGAWQLFIVDDAGIDQGSMTGGWSLSIEAEFPVCVPPPPPDSSDAALSGGVAASGL
jgi:subtilisin-like proprotein convertase family protein